MQSDGQGGYALTPFKRSLVQALTPNIGPNVGGAGTIPMPVDKARIDAGGWQLGIEAGLPVPCFYQPSVAPVPIDQYTLVQEIATMVVAIKAKTDKLP